MRLSVFTLRTVCIYWRKGEAMKKIRYLPFGYTIAKGEIRLQPQEAPIVQNVFKWYLEGETMQRIAERLNCQEVQYNNNTAMWTKHMIHRILVCKKYCSGEKLPVLITADIFQRACILRMGKAKVPRKELSAIRAHAVCACCSNKVYFRTSGERWECPNCGMKTDKQTTENILNAICSLLNDLSSHLERLRPPGDKNNLRKLQV